MLNWKAKEGSRDGRYYLKGAVPKYKALVNMKGRANKRVTSSV